MRSTFTAFCALIVVAGCGQNAGSFQYEQQVGVAHRGEGDEGCIAIANASIEPGTKLVLADQGAENLGFDTSRITEATVVDRLSDCDDNHLYTAELGDLTYYRIRATSEWAGNGYTFAIVQPSGAVAINKDGNIEGDLDSDSMNERFRICTSAEGAHYQVWTGPPLEGKPRWHWYVYAGYDTEVTCTEKDYFGPQ